MCVGRILDAIDDAGIRETTTIILVADHGFTLTPKAIRPNVVLRKAGLLTLDGGELTEAQVHVVPEGGVGYVYCTNPATASQRAVFVQKLLLGQEGVADFLLPDRFNEVGFPHPRENNQVPDAIVVAKDGYGVSGNMTGETLVTTYQEARTALGSHGFLAKSPKMKAMCILSGVGIRPGGKIQGVDNTAVAPTIAKLLGLKYDYAEGKPLSNVFVTSGDQ